MPSFQKYYRRLFEMMGRPLSKSSGLPVGALAAAEKRLGVHVPQALRDYYRVAGGERRVNTCHNRLLPPHKWRVDHRRLIFMEENQSVVFWAVPVGRRAAIDPPVDQGVNDEPIGWAREHSRCSIFLTVMLHYQAVNGGLRFCASAEAPDESSYRFEDHGWTEYGPVGSLTSYGRPNQVVCLMPPDNLPFTQKWTVLAAGKTQADLRRIGDEIGLRFT